MFHNQSMIDKDKNKSNIEFVESIYPIIEKQLKMKGYRSIENNSNPYYLKLDREYCIDGYMTMFNNNEVPVATRILKNNNDIFAIRFYKNSTTITEWDKLLKHYKNNSFLPKYIIQANKHYDNSISIGIVNTKSFIQFAIKQIQNNKHNIIDYGNAKFFSINWNDLINNNVKVYIVRYNKSIN